MAIGWRYLVDDLIDQGLLVPVLDSSVSSDLGYYLVQPERKRRARLTNCFVDWLQQELGDETRQAQLIRHREGIAI
ncbi:DNA-binding transcriptional activator GcvA [compost metagenome]